MIVLPGYSATELIDQRGRHSVYRARRCSDGRAVVIKTRVAALIRNESGISELRHEWEILNGLGAPGLVRALALERGGAGLALVLDDAGPYNLAERLAADPPQLAQILDWSVQIAEALGRLHGARHFHRDINPSNIVLDETGTRTTLVDFETATTLAALDFGGASSPALEGTLPYVSPEQTGRTGRGVDYRTDLYAFGATLYEMLTGEPPFVSDDPLQIVHAHLARRPVPAHERDPLVPVVLSEIVDRLLAKAPEDRYQSAEALAADLCEARERWARTGTIAPFPLSHRIATRELVLPDTLYGRDAALDALREAFARAVEGNRGVVLITGDPGIGKSALVDRLRAPVTERRAVFVSGKFDQLRRAEPYSGLIEAFRGLLRQLLAEDERVLAAWRARLVGALGANGRVLAAILPEVEILLGPQPEVPSLGPAETAMRFLLVFEGFVRALGREASPLVLFLDDLQWVDPASLRLIEHLLGDADARWLLLVGAYRDAEVGKEHPLRRTIDGLRATGLEIHTTELGPLAVEHVAELCADALACAPARARPLAELVTRKTLGNPFFVKRLLRALYAEDLLRFDPRRGAWDWDLGKIDAVALSDSVVDLMVHAIERLPPASRELVALAACVGATVDLGILAAVNGSSRPKTLNTLWPALEEQLLLPLGDAYQAPRAESPFDELLEAREVLYRFAHDRVQQAALSLLDETQRWRASLAVGRILRAKMASEATDERLFDVVDRMNVGAALIDEPTERLHLAELDLRASRKAKASGAFPAALGYATAAAGLLPDDAWATQAAHACAIAAERAECSIMIGEHVAADALVEDALRHAPSLTDALALHEVRIVALSVMGDVDRAVARGREGLLLVGEVLPSPEALARATRDEWDAITRKMRDRRVDELANLPPMEDIRSRAAVHLLVAMSPAAYVVDHTLTAYINARAVHLCVLHGNADASPWTYACYGFAYGDATGDHRTGHAFGKLSVEMARRRGDCAGLSRVLFVVGGLVSPWSEPLRETVVTLREAARVALDCGEVQHAGYALACLAAHHFFMGTPLPEVLDEVEGNLTVTRKAKVRRPTEMLLTIRQATRCLLGLTRSFAGFDDADFDEASFMRDAGIVERTVLQVVRLTCANVLGERELARRLAASSADKLGFIGGMFAKANHAFHAALTYAGACDGAGGDASAARLSQARAEMAKLAAWAEHCPSSFTHKRDLVAAEVARIEGDRWTALELYERAAEGARAEGFTHDEALAEELAGRFHLSRGSRRYARLHLGAAASAYARWGATTKVEAMRRAHGDLLADVELTLVRAPARGASRASSSQPAVAFDAVSLVKATQAISGELVRERLLSKLLRIVLESAGARRGALLFEEEGELEVHASGSVEGDVSLDRTLLTSEWPRSVIDVVTRTGEPLVLPDAHLEPRFAEDPCMRERGIRAVLCVPVRRHGRSVGLVYLENDLTPCAFRRDRVEIVRHLAAQLAISLENARLLRETQEAVRARDDFLVIASHELRTPLTALALSLRFAELALRRDLSPEAETVRKISSRVEAAARQVQRLVELVEVLLDISRITCGRLTIERDRVDLAEVAREVAARLGPSLAQAGCAMKLDASAPVIGRWDRLRLDQVVSNLVSNALKFGAGKPIEITVEAADGKARLCVRDHGIGIAPEEQARVFGRFERAASVKHYGGFGLGLWISHQLVEAHGGTIRVESAPGAGALFTVELPS